MNRNIPVIKIAFYLLAGLFVLLLLNRILLIFTYNLDIVGIEPLFVFKIQTLMASLPIYSPPQHPPFLLNQYNPLYFVFGKYIGNLLGCGSDDIRAIYLIARSMNLIFNVGTALVAYLICRHVNTPKYIAGITAFFVFAVFTAHNYAVRPDSMKTFFLLLSFFYLLKYSTSFKIGTYCYATFFFLIALWTKQDAILYSPFFFLLPFVLNGKKGIGASMIFAASTLATFGLAYLLLGPSYFTSSLQKFALPMDIEIFKGLIRFRWMEILMFVFLIIYSAIRIIKFKQSTAQYLLFVSGLFGYIMGLIAFGKFGASPVYLVDAQILLLISFFLLFEIHRSMAKINLIDICLPILLLTILLLYRQESVLYASYVQHDERTYRSAYDALKEDAQEIGNHLNLDQNNYVLTFNKYLINCFYDVTFFASYDAEFPQLYEVIARYIDKPPTPMIDYDKLQPLIDNGTLKYFIMERNNPVDQFLDVQLTEGTRLLMNDHFILFELWSE